MKIYKNFYFWYLIIFLSIIIIGFIVDKTGASNSFLDLLGNIWFLMAWGFIPVGITQVLMSISFYLEKRKKQWYLYFAFLFLFLLSLLLMKTIEHSLVQDCMGIAVIGSPIVCYITHLILYHFHTKNQPS